MKENAPKIVRGEDGQGNLANGVATPIAVDGGRVIALSLHPDAMKDLETRAAAAGITVEEQTARDLQDIVNW